MGDKMTDFEKRKEKVLQELLKLHTENPTTDIVDIYYRLMLILNDLKNMLPK